MARSIRLAAACAAAALIFGAASAAQADPIKIGMVTTLSTGGGYLGEEVRNGFQLAIEHGGGKLGGVEVELIVEDDARNPGTARQTVTRMLRRENVDIMTGAVFSNVAMASVPLALREGVFYISPNAGPAELAGEQCHENYFNAAWQNDQLHEAMGQYMTDQGIERVYLLAPNYPAGRDALNGFKRLFQGEVIAETYTQLGQTDFAAELSSIRAAEPDGIYFFLPGGDGINFTRQYAQARINERVPAYGPAFSFDNTLVNAVGRDALGIFNTSQWSLDMDNAVNQRFVADYKARYGNQPTLYASQGYDTALLIAHALEATEGNVADQDAFRTALRSAEIDSTRGVLRLGSNHHPIQNVYVREVVEGDDGKLTNVLRGLVLENHQDAYAVDCKM